MPKKKIVRSTTDTTSEMSEIESVAKILPRSGIGLYLGDTDVPILDTIIKNLAPSEVHIVDKWDGQDLLYNMVMSKFSTTGNIVVVRIDPMSIMASYDDHYFDWVWVRSAGVQIPVLKLMKAAIRKIKDGGRIIVGTLDEYTAWCIKRMGDRDDVEVEKTGIYHVLQVHPRDDADTISGSEVELIVERMVEAAHIVWLKKRATGGWHHPKDCPARMEDRPNIPPDQKYCMDCHDCMVPFSQLSEEDKEGSRAYPMEFLKVIKDLGYEIVRRS